ncbi:hypothetical protein [Pediococcus claussenii]|uniref:YolD-like family protein n=1 Tax=Pediococcus claussenii (strain ATCC BAA-344 / DSM 14800 / JCM 18046 / KCTC 3811 / LMG 21948 / P06) TaxID=701521 RepID=G8PDI9_PEDCP|nr:hypothetical protein [Pediococcus claussenii]AEV95324.1 hypothetical protein PECL_1056 [Pediococcus claussenii ATCC BAA-344]ANZ68857.1 hypothetical protein AYR57_00325 [Pediococcus claussenii]ANZ70673.1 hypothetical protein AYR58_00325 [Pediococcus claussenii]KRN19494.1 hypothetical protein IV79_GL001211 [Pediococcus claussenii]
MQNIQGIPFKRISTSLAKIHDSYEKLFNVPEDREQILADRPMPEYQILDVISYSITNHLPVKIQLNIRQNILEATGYLHQNNSGSLRLVNPNSGLTHMLNIDTIRSINNLN